MIDQDATEQWEFIQGRRRATIRLRAGQYAVKWFIVDEGEDVTIGGTLSLNLITAKAKAVAWTKHGETIK